MTSSHATLAAATDGATTSSASLLRCGIFLGPVFYVTFLLQALTRSGYDATRHPISLLSLGEAGWIQILNFILTGALGIGLSFGVKQVLRGRDGGIWLPRLFLIFGIGLVIAGIFPPEPMLGFPPGTPDSVPTSMSLKATLHGVGFLLAFAPLTVATFVHAFRVATSRPWRMYSICTGVLIPILLATGFAWQRATSIAFILVGLAAFGWVGLLSWSLLRRLDVSN